jgi:pimeloyl-ACP methyl ester carboxylesterase
MTADVGDLAPPPRDLPPGHLVELPGRGTTFVRDCSGPPGAPTLLLLHGLLATADLNWSGCYGALGDHFRVVAVDHRGHGRGIHTHHRFRLADCADDAVAVAQVLGIDTFIAVGYSMGGPIAQLVWHRHRPRVDGLVLCATGRNFRRHASERARFDFLGFAAFLMRLTPRPVWHRVIKRIAARRITDEETEWRWSEFRRSDPVKFIEAAQALGHFSSYAWIGNVDVPTAVVVTTRDRLVRPQRQYKLASAIHDASVYEIDADHPVAVREPERFAPVLLEACLDVASRCREQGPRRGDTRETG